MTNTCIVCKKERVFGDSSRSFHKFPDDDKEKHKWLQAIGITSVTKHSRICSDHFYANSFHDTDGYTTIRRLLPNAIPYITKNAVLSNEILQDLKCSDIKKPVNINNKYKKCINELPANQSFFIETPTLLKETEIKSSVTHDRSYDDLINTYGTDISPNHFELQDHDTCNISLTSDNCESSKRKLPDIIDVDDFNPKKKIRFMDGFQATHISREDFISDEAWKRFLKYHFYRLRQVEAGRKKNLRKMKKITNLKELVKTLPDEKNAAANYLKENSNNNGTDTTNTNGNGTTITTTKYCFVCNENKTEGQCRLKSCAKTYHLSCVKLQQWPKENWYCPRHKCFECGKKYHLKSCTRCIKSFCKLHADNKFVPIDIEHPQPLMCIEHQPELPQEHLIKVEQEEEKPTITENITENNNVEQQQRLEIELKQEQKQDHHESLLSTIKLENDNENENKTINNKKRNG